MNVKYYHSYALDLTNKCNGKCFFCPRNGMIFKEYVEKLSEFDFNLFKKIFDYDYIRHISHLVFNGNLGDPIFHSRLFDFFKYIEKNNPNITVTMATNGSIRNKKWWEELAKYTSYSNNKVMFGIDGLNDTHHLYRGTSYKIVLRNMISFINAGGRAVWQFITFKHNEHQVEKAKKIARELGCKNFITVISRDYNQELERPSFLDVKTKYELCKESTEKIFCTPIENRHLYISHDSHIFPCCDYGLFKSFRQIEKYPNKLYIEYLKSLNDIDLSKSTIEKALKSSFFRYIIENNSNLVRCIKSCRIKNNNCNGKIQIRGFQ